MSITNIFYQVKTQLYRNQILRNLNILSVHLPTIALGDIVLTSAAEHGGGQEISWSVGTPGAAHQEEVIFVSAAEQQ